MYRKAPPEGPVQLLTHPTRPEPGIDTAPESFSGAGVDPGDRRRRQDETRDRRSPS
jgi:hypothetical protein